MSSLASSAAAVRAASAPAKGNRVSPLQLALIVNAIFAGFCLLPRVRDSRPLLLSIGSASLALAAFTAVVFTRLAKTGRAVWYRFVPRPVHYVQFVMHSSIYVYWGMYWPQVRLQAPLLFAQIAFVMLLDMLISWLRRDEWILGFGPVPIVLSTNLFLWFRDDWFYLQFAMLAVGVLAKEFIRWKRDGRSAHIFNPSAFPLFLVSVILLATGKTDLSWGPQIAQTLHLPPQIYLEIFILGLIVQALFSVTLVTLAAASVLYILNVAYTHQTGLYHFIDSNIPVSVFIGLHLLVTDPATSPRSAKAKFIFGALYGGCVYGLYTLLGMWGCPQFYDKLLSVVPLNLMVRRLDWLNEALERFAAKLKLPHFGWSSRQLNFAHMGVWIALFSAMTATGFVGHKHPGQDPEFWHKACDEHRGNACKVWVRTLHVGCDANMAGDCWTLGQALAQGVATTRDPAEAGKSVARACDLGLAEACGGLQAYAGTEVGRATLERSCDRGDGASCFIAGSVWHLGRAVTRDDARAVALFDKSCAAGWPRGCARLGESYAFGEGVAKDPARALSLFEKACDRQYGPACVNAAVMYHRGDAVPKNSVASRLRFRAACNLGIQEACKWAESPSI